MHDRNALHRTDHRFIERNAVRIGRRDRIHGQSDQFRHLRHQPILGNLRRQSASRQHADILSTARNLFRRADRDTLEQHTKFLHLLQPVGNAASGSSLPGQHGWMRRGYALHGASRGAVQRDTLCHRRNPSDCVFTRNGSAEHSDGRDLYHQRRFFGASANEYSIQRGTSMTGALNQLT